MLTNRVEAALKTVNDLCETTPTPNYSAAPDPNVLKALLPECEDTEFWQNFRKAAPIIFCMIDPSETLVSTYTKENKSNICE